MRRVPVLEVAEAVRTARRDEVSPAAVGLDADAPRRLDAAVGALYATALFPAIGLTIRRHGQLVYDRAVGHARGNGPEDGGAPRVLATPDTPHCIFSASKAVTATVVHLLDDRGLLHVDDRVCEYIPEFARRGKEWVTIRHLLTHRAGLPSLRAERGLDLLLRPDAVIEILCDAELESAPGRRLAYHAITGGFLLGEIVQRVTGRGIAEVLRAEILDPLGFDGMGYGWRADRLDEVAVNAFTGPPVPWPLASLARRALGVDFELAAGVSNTREWLTAVVPAGNIVATGAEVTRFMEMLRLEGELDGVRVMRPRTVRRALVETSHMELDLTMLLPIRYGLGYMLGANWFSVFGPDTPRAFGHLGLTNTFVWADPSRAMSVALLTSGKPLFSGHLAAIARVLRAINGAVPVVG
ncbi:MAG TPA: serine hydrolase domain-containing protein [Myxococcota bacterium]|nr:serine hydrolase domain-containing protein [Myxococcota bacterium]